METESSKKCEQAKQKIKNTNNNTTNSCYKEKGCAKRESNPPLNLGRVES